MLDAGIIKPSTCADVNSPIFLKKDSSKRYLRQLNSIVAPKLIQLPKINELMESKFDEM